MTVAALITWFFAVVVGLFLLAIWLIEYDREFQGTAATRLPVPVISLHALLALGGLIVWAVYLVGDQSRLAWAAMITVGVVALLGAFMAVRWIPVRRSVVAARRARGTGPRRARTEPALPAERNFPLPAVAAHGIFAAVTVILVLVTTLGGS